MSSVASVVGRDRLEPPIAQQRLVRADLVKPFPFREPLPFTELEQSRRVVWFALRVDLERTGVEVDLDEGEQSARLAVASPEDAVVPVGLVPAMELRPGLRSRKIADEPRLQPLALLSKKFTRVVNVDLFGELTYRSP